MKKINNFIKVNVQNYRSENFEKTKDGKNLKKLKNIHLNKRCFIIGNGPSLIPEDMDVLNLNNEITFGFNRIFYIFDKTEWRPSYYITQDEKMIKGCIEDLNNIDVNKKFIPINLKWYHEIKLDNVNYFFLDYVGGNKEIPDFSDEISKKIVAGATVVYSAVQMAIYMGIKEIILLGIDHNFNKSIDKNGNILIDKNIRDYFCDEYNLDKDDLYIPNLDNSIKTYIAIDKYCEARGIKLYNATRGGKLEVFERVNFDDIKFDK